jgi:hypothetical protein
MIEKQNSILKTITITLLDTTTLSHNTTKAPI